jgi:hypothetical protein
MSKLISSHLKGGLGNQLFQAAHAIAQGKISNRDVVFLPKSQTPMQGRQTKNYVDNIFRNLTFVQNLDGFKLVSEKTWEFNKVSILDNNTIFDGYFQSSKNFFGYDDHIKNIFSPTNEFIEQMFDIYPQLDLENTLSIHIRRGDCFLNPDIHPIATEKYVEKALSEIGVYSHVFIFSDDKDWVKNNLKFSNTTYIDDEDYKELWLMSLCKNNIIVNSTFSWWGSFLNKNPNKKIIAPSIWFGPRGPKIYKDIYEPYWKIIEVTYENGWLN